MVGSSKLPQLARRTSRILRRDNLLMAMFHSWVFAQCYNGSSLEYQALINAPPKAADLEHITQKCFS